MTEQTRYPRVSSFKTATDFRRHAGGLGIELACEDQVLKAPDSPLSWPLEVEGRRVGNRFAIHPMEGWDGTEDGMPSDLTRRRWQHFGQSGAKLIWGGEAFAVCPEGRANPNQLLAKPEGMAELRQVLLEAHARECGDTGDLLLGIQLTHSGRFCRPVKGQGLIPAILYHHPVLDRKFGLRPEYPVLSDEYIEELIGQYIEAACAAADAGYHFVDIKHCHGYLGHEFLSARTRTGRFGGSLENRTRFCRLIAEGIRQRRPGLLLGVRLSAFDFVPFRADPSRAEGKKLGLGIPEEHSQPYQVGFGLRPDNPLRMDLEETGQFIELLGQWGIKFLNLSCGSPYYNPHIQRPALFPPSDGYQPPEDPLVGVARQINMLGAIKTRFPDRILVGTGYTYLQEYLPQVGQHYVRQGQVDFVGLGRMVLSYPDLPAQVLGQGRMDRKRICRTFSDCTTAPRKGMVSGCFPLDPFYKGREEAEVLKKIKAGE
ncbi:MAG: NADH:flavin oxidoreductase [Candidatus Handelsmanbacteria bacterium]|nr:NADH:flavin oxidoreductase [Candidatus Handelsmanbacteria bacterium]